MAGLSHNALALNCVKNGGPEADGDASAICAYCEKNNPETMDRLELPGEPVDDGPNFGPLDTTDIADHAAAVSDVAQVVEAPARELPPLGKFLQRIGIQKGATYRRIATVDGEILENVELIDVGALDDGGPLSDVALSFREEGVAGTPEVVMWSKVVSFRRAR